jgi:hypothetical protein
MKAKHNCSECNNCTHKIVCGKFRATGGVRECEHHKEERKGEWIFRKKWDRFVCSECSFEKSSCSHFCPNCGADMRGAEDG